jgi:hypothetical protein
MSAMKEHYHDEIEKQTRIMNKLQLQFKADTGNGYLTETAEGIPVKDMYGDRFIALRITDFPLEYILDNSVVFPSPEYIRWLEEKVETMQKLPTNNI